MKKLLKYLLPVIAVLAFWNCMDAPVRSAAEEVSVAMSLEEAAYQTTISDPESELCLPRQVSSANFHRVQSTARRTGGACRNNIEFIKAGKMVNADIKYSVQIKDIIIHSSLIEPAHRLLCLGRLII